MMLDAAAIPERNNGLPRSYWTEEAPSANLSDEVVRLGLIVEGESPCPMRESHLQVQEFQMAALE